MTGTVIWRLCAPTQSWGAPGNHHQQRPSSQWPLHSSLTGMVCAALGYERGHPGTGDVAAMDLTVRIDHPGKTELDFQTIAGTVNTSGARRAGGQVTSQRGLLHDACFTVFASWQDTDLARRVETALKAPVWPLCLGRRAFPVTTALRPAWFGDAADDDLVGSWAPCQVHPPGRDTWEVVEQADTFGPGAVVDDSVCADFDRRDHHPRVVRRRTIPRTDPKASNSDNALFTVDASGRLLLPGETDAPD